MNLSEAHLFGKKNGTGLKVEGSEFKVWGLGATLRAWTRLSNHHVSKNGLSEEI